VHGVGETSAAISIVNALPTGVGAAVGIELLARAEVELHPAGSHGKWDVRVTDEARTPLVIGALTESLRRFAPGSSGTGKLALRSDIPIARGLKSSSAVSSAIVLAVARATDNAVPPIEVARISAAVSLAAGVSATGALDDALAGLTPGIVVTDNRRGTLLKSYPLGGNLGVALLIPAGSHPPSPDRIAVFREEAMPGRTAVNAALEGQWATAMLENTRLVERVMGYDYRSLRDQLTNRGAIASGVSGLGPALAAIAPNECLTEVVSVLARGAGDPRTVAFSTQDCTQRGSSP
jgi:shikimate kinase